MIEFKHIDDFAEYLCLLYDKGGNGNFFLDEWGDECVRIEYNLYEADEYVEIVPHNRVQEIYQDWLIQKGKVG